MIIKEITVKKRDVMTQHDCAALVQRAMRYDADITLEFHSKKVNGKSLMGVISLGLHGGDKFMIIVKGHDEEALALDIEHLNAREFAL